MARGGRRLSGVALAFVAFGACGGSEAPAKKTLPLVGRRALLDPRPVLVAQAIPGTAQAIVALDEGGAVPSTRLADLDALTLRTVWPRPATLVGSAGGKASLVVPAPELQLQLPPEVLQLDLATGAVQAVTPPAWLGPSAINPGSSVGGSYLYATAEGRIADLLPGAAQASLLPAGDCPVTGPPGLQASARKYPGWFLFSMNEKCPGGRPEGVTTFRLINPAKAVASSDGLRFYEGSSSLFFVSTAGGLSQLVRINPETGVSTPVAGAVGVGVPGPDVEFRSRDGRFLYLGRYGSLLELDLVAETVRSLPTQRTPAPVIAATGGEVLGVVIDSAIVRLDLNKVTPFCGAGPDGAALARPTSLPDAPFGAFCAQGATLTAYDWATDSIATLTTANTAFVRSDSNHVVWTEAGGSRVARIGGGGRAVAPCAGTFERIIVSEDGSTAIVSCNGSDALVVDLATGVSQTALAAPAGATLTLKRTALSSRGRLAALSYSTSAAAGDPIACAADTCTWVFDRVTGQGARAPAAEALANAGLQVIGSLRDESAFVMPADQAAGTILVTTTTGAPRTALLAGSIGLTHRAGDALLATGPIGYFRLDLGTGAVSPLGRPAGTDFGRIGSSSDFFIGDAIYRLASNTFEPLPSPLQLLCGGQPALSWLDPTGIFTLHGPFPLRRYSAEAGVQTVFATAMVTEAAGCAGVRAFVDVNGLASRLVRYDIATGATTELAPNVYAGRLIQAGGHEFVLQSPADQSGDVALLDEATHTLRPLGARARIDTGFVFSGDRMTIIGGPSGGPILYAARLDGSGAVELGPGGNAFTSPDGTRILWLEGPAIHLETEQGPGTVAEIAGPIAASDESSAHLIYVVALGPTAGTWGFSLH